jgi:hypothetical protein
MCRAVQSKDRDVVNLVDADDPGAVVQTVTEVMHAQSDSFRDDVVVGQDQAGGGDHDPGAGFAVSCAMGRPGSSPLAPPPAGPSGDPDVAGTGGHPGAPPADVTATSSTNEARLRP